MKNRPGEDGQEIREKVVVKGRGARTKIKTVCGKKQSGFEGFLMWTNKGETNQRTSTEKRALANQKRVH